MKIITALRLAASGLATQRVRLDVSAMNLANANVTRTLEGGPYRAKDVVVAAAPLPPDFADNLDQALSQALSQAQVVGIVDDKSPFREVYGGSRIIRSDNIRSSQPGEYNALPDVGIPHEKYLLQ